VKWRFIAKNYKGIVCFSSRKYSARSMMVFSTDDKTQSSRSIAEASQAPRGRACTSRRGHCSFERQDTFGKPHDVWSTDVSRGKSTHRGSTTETLETGQGESKEQFLTCSFTPFAW